MIEYVYEKRVVSFDGRVLEMFGRKGTYGAWHLAFLESAEIYPDKKGERHYIRFNFTSGTDIRPFTNPEVVPEGKAQAEALVDVVNKAIAAR
jgi:hypothetical protein